MNKNKVINTLAVALISWMHAPHQLTLRTVPGDVLFESEETDDREAEHRYREIEHKITTHHKGKELRITFGDQVLQRDTFRNVVPQDPAPLSLNVVAVDIEAGFTWDPYGHFRMEYGYNNIFGDGSMIFVRSGDFEPGFVERDAAIRNICEEPCDIRWNTLGAQFTVRVTPDFFERIRYGQDMYRLRTEIEPLIDDENAAFAVLERWGIERAY